jgi:hypothetical protein
VGWWCVFVGWRAGSAFLILAVSLHETLPSLLVFGDDVFFFYLALMG